MPPAGAATAAGRVLEVSGQGEELLFMLFPHLRGLRVHRVADTGEAVVISGVAAGRRRRGARRAGRCPRGCMAGIRGWWPTARPAAARC